MNGLLEGKVAVITGAGSGVGRAACLLFARHGARIVAADIDLDNAEETAAQLRASGGSALAQRCNVADEAAVTQLVETAAAEFGRLDIMYNNAGISIPSTAQGPKPLIDTGADEIQRLQDVNVGGVINGCKAAIRLFDRQGGGGVIVNTASVAGLTGYGGVAYGATKGAVVNLTRALALEVAPRGIRINSVCPSGMPTHFGGMDPEGPHAERIRASMAAAHPLGRPVEPIDCANGALFLASDLASNITGVNLPVDGGLLAGIFVRR